MEQTLTGTIIYGDEFEQIEGNVIIENGIIKNIEESNTPSDTIIAPCFINAHTHIGDSVIKDPPFLSLEELVQPKHGLKHRVLKNIMREELVASMKASIQDMIKSGTCAFADFREGGVEGIVALHEALMGNDIKASIFGRPYNGDMGYLDLCDGTGLSSTNDMDIGYIKDVVWKTKRKKKKFAIHAGERDPYDISPALELEPDFLIHLTHASKKEIKAVAQANVPVVVCVRSNFLTRSGFPPIKDMINEGILVAAGTDNVMLNSVNMFSEMEFLVKTNLFDDKQVFKICTLNGAKLLGMDELGSIKKGKKAKLMILTKRSNNMHGIKNPLRSLVRRARPDDIIRII